MFTFLHFYQIFFSYNFVNPLEFVILGFRVRKCKFSFWRFHVHVFTFLPYVFFSYNFVNPLEFVVLNFRFRGLNSRVIVDIREIYFH